MTKIAIIGAGLAGLTAAKSLCANAEVQIFEKSWRAGGRMSTRTKVYGFDHGAQYFTARSKAFKAFLQPFIQRGIIARWDACFAELDRSTPVNRRQWGSEYPHYVAVPGMNALCVALSSDMNVQYKSRVTSILPAGSKWKLEVNEDRSPVTFDWVISAIPAQQTAALMPDDFSYLKQIRQKKMLGCYTLMLGFKRPLKTDFDCALVNNADISWISVNSSKPGRSKSFALIVHSTNQWAEENIELHDDRVKRHLINEACDVLQQDISHANHIQLHRWRYANIEKQTGEKALLDRENQLAAIGDWCIKGRVESAFISARNLAIK
jgi:predicted NAD/FAD-dependent oxidoreductase